jgi:hypothetical protein
MEIIQQMSSSDWKTLGLIGMVLGAIVMLHGVSNRRWQQMHTAAAILTAASVIGPRLAR